MIIPSLSAGIHSSFQSLNVKNRDFKNIQGLNSLGGGWYGAAGQSPFNWITSTSNTNAYKLYTSDNIIYWANLQTTSLYSPFEPMYQNVGTTTNLCDIVVTFTASNLLVSPSNVYLGSALYANAISHFPLTFINNTYSNTTNSTYTASNVAAGTDIILAFWGASSGPAVAITNISIQAK